MRINGKNIEREFRTVKIPRQSGSIEIKVWSVPIGLKRMYAEINPRPMPPKRTINNVKTGTTEVTDWDDQAFIKLMQEWDDLQNYFMLFCVMNGAEGNEFDTQRVLNVTDLRALKAEFAASGFSEGDCALITKAALKASNVDEAEVAKASENF